MVGKVSATQTSFGALLLNNSLVPALPVPEVVKAEKQTWDWGERRKKGKGKGGEKGGQVHVSWVSWGGGGRAEVPMHTASAMDQHVLAGVCGEGLLPVLLAPSAFALEIQARCKQHDSPWKPFPAGHKGVKAKGACYCLGLGRKNTQLPFHWALPGPE